MTISGGQLACASIISNFVVLERLKGGKMKKETV
jgi:hypothetical protein